MSPSSGGPLGPSRETVVVVNPAIYGATRRPSWRQQPSLGHSARLVTDVRTVCIVLEAQMRGNPRVR